MILFVLEIVITALGISDYLFSILFWLDVLSTLSILMDFESVRKSFFGHSEDAAMSDTTEYLQSHEGASMIIYAARVTRIVRVIRMIRIFGLYRGANQETENESTKRLIQDIVKESNVSEDLAK